MTKNIIKFLSIILLILLIIIFYLSTYGINTTQFNSLIKNEVKSYNKNLDIKVKKVKLILRIKDFSLNVKTLDSLILYKEKNIKISELATNLSIKDYLDDNFWITNLSIKSNENDIKDIIKIYKSIDNSPQLFLIDKIVKGGSLVTNIKLNFDRDGKIKNDYEVYGEVKNAKLELLNRDILNNLKLNFEIKKNNYNLNNISLKFNDLDLESEEVEIIKKKKIHLIKGDFKSKKNKIEKNLISIIPNELASKFNFENSFFNSDNNFSFDINNKYKINNLKVSSNIYIDKLKYKDNLIKFKNYLPDFKEYILLSENNFIVEFSKKKLKIEGKSIYSLNDIDNNFSFNINKIKNNLNFKVDIDLNKLNIKINELNYLNNKNKKTKLIITGQIQEKKNIIINNLNYVQENNYIKLKNLILNKDYKVKEIDELKLNYNSVNEIKNNVSLLKNKNKYILSGNSFDGIKLIENLTDTSTKGNFFDVFDNLSTEVNVKINKTYLSKLDHLNLLNGKLSIENNKIINATLLSEYSKKDKFLFSIKTSKNGDVVTTLSSGRAKPFVKNFKFIKGFEKGILDFQSVKKNNISRSVLKIDNFKVKEVPILAKILTLASLQGIADLLTGEGIRFSDFEMIFSNKNELMTIDEIYAIGPAISIMMSGYVESDKLISLRGTLVPARTINRTIASIPLVGDILIGKKVGEGVFGVSFKIKGPPKNLKTTVNPIKTLTPRFITRTLEKIKKTNQ